MKKNETISPDNTEFGKIHRKRQANKKVRRIEVEEWGKDGKPLVLYAYPLTVNDVIELDAKYVSQAEQNVMQIIRQCRKENGDLYFTLLDKTSLLNEPSDIIGELLIELNGKSSTFDSELKKNNE